MRAIGTNRTGPLPAPAEEDAQVLLVLAAIASFIPGLVGAVLDSLAAGIAGTGFPAEIARAALSGIALLTRVIGTGILGVLALACVASAVVHVRSTGRDPASDTNWALAALYAAGAAVAAAGLLFTW